MLLLLLLPFSTRCFSILEPQWHLVARLALDQQAADQLGGEDAGGASEEGLGEGWEVLGGAGRCWEVLGGAGRCWEGVVAMGVAV